MVFNAILWITQSGSAWSDLPEHYGPWKTVYSRFCKWRDDGTLQTIFNALNKDADYENLSIDSTLVKARQQQRRCKKRAAGHETSQQIGKSRGGITTKIHAVVDGLGSPVYFQLSAVNVNDSTLAVDILSHVELSGSNIRR